MKTNRNFLFLLIFILLLSGCTPYFWEGFAEGYQAAKQNKPAAKASKDSYGDHKCPSCGMSMYFTGESKSEWGKLLYLYECPVGHTWWFPAQQTQTSTYAKNPCPICGMEIIFTGETYTEWGKLFAIYECPAGHRSVKPFGE